MTATLVIVVPYFLLASAVIIMIAWRQGGGAPRSLVGYRQEGRLHFSLTGTAAVVGLWLLLTLLTLWCAFLTWYVAIHVLLFWLGSIAAWAKLMSGAAFLLSIPFIWGWAILR